METDYIRIMKTELKRALGCTEPAAVALACAYAGNLLEHRVERIELFVSANILKNGLQVGIPGTDKKGIQAAAALGALAGEPQKGLEVLNGIDAQEKERALRLAEEGMVPVQVKDGVEKLYIEAACYGPMGEARAIIRGIHTNLAFLSLNGVQRGGCQDHIRENGGRPAEGYGMDTASIFRFVSRVEISRLSFLKEIIGVQKEIAGEGLAADYGMGVGRRLMEDVGADGDLADYVTAVTAAAADARMAGCPLPVFSNTGSGNQGLAASLPVIAAAERMGKGEEELLRALALSELITIHVKESIGRLSPLCGCAIAASVGSSAGITMLMGGGYGQIVSAIQNMIADVSGLICDGAKAGCALKIATAVMAAVQCSRLAVKNIRVPDKDGIVNVDVERSIANLGILGKEGMRSTDGVILGMMLQNA